MSENSTNLPKGYDPSSLTGKLKKLSPVQKELQSLMVRSDDHKNKRDIDHKSNPPIAKLKSLSDVISNNIQSQTDLRSITPYIKRAEQIWTTLLLRPNGFEKELLRYNTIDSPIKNYKLHSILLQSIKTYFSTVYPFEDILPLIIKDVMFRTGSYVLLDLPYSAIDHLINGMAVSGSEALKTDILQMERGLKQTFYVGNDFTRAKNTGWIRKTPREKITGFESVFNDTDKGEEFDLVHKELGWTFTDNPIVIKTGQLLSTIIDDQLKRNSGLENLDDYIKVNFTKQRGKPHKVNNNHVNITDTQSFDKVLDEIYPNRNYQQKESLFVRKEIYYTGHGKGNGVSFHPPSESCIPVHLNGEKNKPIGFIFLTEPSTGEFLKTTGDVKFYSSYKNRSDRLDSKSGVGSLNNIISNLKNVSQGKDCEIDMDWAVDMVHGLLEKEIIESFLNGDKAVPVSISLTDANVRLYLSRSLRQQGVRSVFVPASHVTYFALDYNDFGVGKSLVEEAKMVITRLAILDIADTVANLENAIPRATVSIDLEEENFAPQELVNQVRENYLINNPSLLNYVGFSSLPVDKIIDGIKSTFVKIKVNANDNKNIINPNIEESIDERYGTKTVDPDSRDKVLNDLSGFFDLKRSWLEDSEQGNDFAIEAAADQELLNDIKTERSAAFSKLVSEHFGKHIRINETLMGELIDIIKANKNLYEKPDQGNTINDYFHDIDDVTHNDIHEGRKIALVLNDFLNNLDISLPAPTTKEQYLKLVDKLEAADRLVEGWKSIGIATDLLSRVLRDMGLDTITEEEQGPNAAYIMSLIDGVLRREAYKSLGISIPFDEIVADGRKGGMMTYITEAVQQRENVVSFIDELFKQLRKGNKRYQKIGEKYKDDIVTDVLHGDDGYNEEYYNENEMEAEEETFDDFEPEPEPVEESTEEVTEEVEEVTTEVIDETKK